MQIIKHKESKVNVNYFYFSGKVDLDEKYFIEKIKQGCAAPGEKNYQTNIKGKMTDWGFFLSDQNFLNILTRFIDTVDKNINMGNYYLKSSWGFSVGYGGQTDFHKHIPSVWSGVLYLNSSTQELKFPEINKSIKPERGVFALFSPFLMHGCEPNNDEISKFGISFNLDELVEKW